MRRELEKSGLVIGESSEPSRCDILVGYHVDLLAKCVSHQNRRVYMLYRATRLLIHIKGATQHVAEVYIGHVVAFFMLHRTVPKLVQSV